jgi:FG-GAP repeat
MQMGAMKARLGLFSLGMLLVGGLVVVSAVWAQGEVSFIARRDFRVGDLPASITVGDFNGDGRPDLATANVNANTVSILINNTSGLVVNDLVTFEPIRSTFTFTPDPTGCPAGFVGTFRFEARLTNVSERSLSALVVAVTTLTNGNLLQNADGGPGGTGARLTVPQEEDFTDGVLSPEEAVDVAFRICLMQRRPFRLEVAVVGVVDASADAHAKAQPVK